MARDMQIVLQSIQIYTGLYGTWHESSIKADFRVRNDSRDVPFMI